MAVKMATNMEANMAARGQVLGSCQWNYWDQRLCDEAGAFRTNMVAKMVMNMSANMAVRWGGGFRVMWVELSGQRPFDRRGLPIPRW